MLDDRSPLKMDSLTAHIKDGRRKKHARSKPQEFIVRVREVLLVDYFVEAIDEAAARKAVEEHPTTAPKHRHEVEMIDWRVMRVTKIR